MYYAKFDIKLLNENIFFPNSHLFDNTNINQLFFGGKIEYMKKIMNYFTPLEFSNEHLKYIIIY